MEVVLPTNGPNQYETPCTVEVSRSDGTSRMYTFSDFQLAYMWVQDYIASIQDDWTLQPFQDAANELTLQFQQRGHRAFVCVADTDSIQISISYGAVRYT